MADLKVKDLAQGTGMFNLMRQLGGSLGIAVMATLLARFVATEKAVLVEHVGANDPETLSRLSLLTRGADLARNQPDDGATAGAGNP